MDEAVIGPGNAGGEGFARRLNRKDWFEQNGQNRRLTEAEEMVFAIVLSVAAGLIGAIALVEGVQAADAAMSR